jgi:hypothetical protein
MLRKDFSSKKETGDFVSSLVPRARESIEARGSYIGDIKLSENEQNKLCQLLSQKSCVSNPELTMAVTWDTYHAYIAFHAKVVLPELNPVIEADFLETLLSGDLL